MSKYVDLTKLTTTYAKRMNLLSNKIFGEVFRPTNRKSMKVVKIFSEKPIHKREEVIHYYPRHPQIGWLMRNLRLYGLFRDEHLDWKEEIERQRVLKGKKPRVKKSLREK
ncbi:GSCOCG00002730001-RA-CDS [Cotesia congregata]|nr:GSCOCG00002730001-RA-CDS [Cotesia congregata]